MKKNIEDEDDDQDEDDNEDKLPASFWIKKTEKYSYPKRHSLTKLLA